MDLPIANVPSLYRQTEEGEKGILEKIQTSWYGEAP